tara:strand:- start:537 stop:959 length:423 start_codon:yes stop_codon:yes gene_type:complete
MNLKVIIIFLIIINFFTNLSAETNHLKEGKELFKNEKYKKARIKFEKDIVFNPKSEESYLYLAKIFNKEENNNLEENNLNTVILLNPKNEEAIYRLAILSIKKSDFSKTEELIKTFNLVCNKLCSSKKELQEKLKSLQKQ